MIQPIQGQRIILRQMTNDDRKDITEHLQDADIGRYIPPIPDNYSFEDASWYVNDAHNQIFNKKGYPLAMHSIQDDKLIGTITLGSMDHKSKKAELGYWLAKPYWRQGLTSEAVDLMVDFGFMQLGLHRIYAKVIGPNQGSANLLLKKGFILEGTEREAELVEGIFHDCHTYGLLKSEYIISDNPE